jgi:hypothetical protein
MLTARSGSTLIFGLSPHDIEELLIGDKPIEIDLTELGEAQGHVIIFYGRTDGEMKQRLIECGLQLP